MERLITIKRAAQALQVSERHLRNLQSQGRLQVVRIGRSVRLRRRDVERLCSPETGSAVPGGEGDGPGGGRTGNGS